MKESTKYIIAVSVWIFLCIGVAFVIKYNVQGGKLLEHEKKIHELEKKYEGLNLIHEEILLYKSIEDSLFSQGGVFMRDEDIRAIARIVLRYHYKYGTSGTIPVGLDWYRILSWLEIESAFNPNATSSAGALGLTQQMPFTAQEGLEKYMNIKVSIEETKKLALRPLVSMVLGLERLVEYQQRFIELGHASSSDWKLSFSLYNWSRKSVIALMSAKSKKTDKASLKYALDIERKMLKYKGGE